jgi:hypothetical protein
MDTNIIVTYLPKMLVKHRPTWDAKQANIVGTMLANNVHTFCLAFTEQH